MIRFAGMTPSNEIEIEKTFLDRNNCKINIQAGKNDWTVLCFIDGSTFYKDEHLDTKTNFNNAYEAATDIYGELKEIADDIKYDYIK